MKTRLLGAIAGLLALAPAAASPSPKVSIDLQCDRPLLSARRNDTLVLRLGVRADAERSGRAPLNLALVLDRSGSMQGAKISRLREAARHAIMRLRRDDVLSIIAFDTEVRVLRRASKVGDAREALSAVDRLEADGSTALYAGTEAGLRELSEFQGRGRVSRMILISDGMANVGPSSPSQLAQLGREAGRRGIPITTFGLGYDFAEDLMTRLALASDGNHAFIPDEGSLAGYFDREMGEALSVAARDLVIEITLGRGVRFKGSLDRDLESDGRILRWKLGQLPSGVEKRLLVELEGPAVEMGEVADIAQARIDWADAQGRSQEAVKASVTAKGAAVEEALQSLNAPVAADAAMARANQKREEAIRLKDSGRDDEARQVLMENVRSLKEAEKVTGVRSLGASAGGYEAEAGAMSAPPAEWNGARKTMKAKSVQEQNQQSY